MTVRPWDFQISMILRRLSMPGKSRLEVGSSRTMTAGESVLTEPQAIRCFSPPDSSNMLRSSSGRRFNSPTAFSIRERTSGSGIPMFSQENASSLVVSTLKNCDRGF